MGSLFDVIDYNQGNMAKKVVTQKRQVDGEYIVRSIDGRWCARTSYNSIAYVGST